MHEDFLAHSEKAQDLEYVHITNKEESMRGVGVRWHVLWGA